MNSSFEPGTEAKAPLIITDTSLSIMVAEKLSVEVVAHPTSPPTLSNTTVHPHHHSV